MKPLSVEGRCRCGRVRFLLREEPISFYLCHCTLCQAESGSAFGQSMAVRDVAIADVTGLTREHSVDEDDGRRVHTTVCDHCLTLLWSYSDAIPKIRGLNAGCLDASSGLEPYGNMWTRSARPWVALAPGPQFEQNPEDPLALIHAWNARPGR